MTEDYKYLLNPPPPPPKTPSPWTMMLGGITLGVAIAATVAYFVMAPKPTEEPAASAPAAPEKKKKGKDAIEISAEPIKVEDIPPGASFQGPNGPVVFSPQNKRPTFDFYTILPDLELVVSDAELARSNPNPNAPSQVIQGMPPATAQTATVPGTPPALPPPHGYQPQPGAGGMMPVTAAATTPQTVAQGAQRPPGAPIPSATAVPPTPAAAPIASTAPAVAPAVSAAATPPAAPPKAPTPPTTAATTPPPAAPQVAPPSDSSVYTLQFGSYRSGTDADRVRGELALLGVSADVQQVQVNNQIYFRVRSGPYNGSAASKIQQRLNDSHIQHIVMKAK